MALQALKIARTLGTKRTREAPAAVKARGIKLGNPANLKPHVEQRTQVADAYAAKLKPMLASLAHMPQRAQVVQINAMGVPAPHGGSWHLAILQRVLRRL